ncbi:MAG: EscU/YscU/HrcU family type III secretion system export apparatus switch protein [Leptospiraceae bacterium]|nr:EscU/YscU/HrcU family type III secretion system export apparatus switch protein [Leptospiraceae bacterium]
MIEILEVEYHIDLQLFAAEDEGRTEEGSERRRREEYDKGNIPKSQELPAALVLLASVITVYLLGNFLFTKSFELFRKYFQGIVGYNRFASEEMSKLFISAIADTLTLLFPVLGISLIVAIAGNIVQVGFQFSSGATGFKFEKIVPNFSRVIPSKQTLFNLSKSLAKIALIGWVSYVIISMDFYSVLISGELGIKGAFSLIAFSGLKIFIVVGIILFIISIYDYYYQKSEFEDSIKMTPSEARQELKEAEGDKTFVNRRRQMIQDMIRKGMLQKVPKADVIVVNPTHYSIALQYDPRIHNAPVVLAKGEDELALIIRRLAKKHEIPIVEDRVQARLLYEEVEIDAEIPAKFFRAVSLIISRLDKFRKVA